MLGFSTGKRRRRIGAVFQADPEWKKVKAESKANGLDEVDSSDHAVAMPHVFPKKVTSGPVITVVTRAMITSMVKMCCERMPMS